MTLLLFTQPGANSRSIFLDAARGCREAGHTVLFWELEPMWRAYERDAQARPRLTSEFSALVQSFIAANRIDASIGMWVNTFMSFMNVNQGGTTVPFFQAINHPHLLFWLDAPHWAHQGGVAPLFGGPLLRAPKIHHYINNGETAREMTEVLGFTNVLPRRYGVNESVFRPHDEPREFDIVFGSGPGDPAPTPEALKELESDRPDTGLLRAQAAAAIRPELDTLAASAKAAPASLTDLLRKLLEAQVEARHQPMLTRLDRLAADPSLAPAAAFLRREPKLWVEATMKIRGVERFERAFTLAYLARRFNVATFGPGDYSAWGCRAKCFGEIKYEDQARLYSRGKIGLNIMRWQDDAGLNLKCYEITASGAACLAGRRAGLDDCFEVGHELAAFDSPADAAAQARELLDSPARLTSMAEAGRDRTLRDHTWTAWAKDLLPQIT